MENPEKPFKALVDPVKTEDVMPYIAIETLRGSALIDSLYYLLRQNEDLFNVHHNGMTPMMFCIKNKKWDGLDFLLSNKTESFQMLVELNIFDFCYKNQVPYKQYKKLLFYMLQKISVADLNIHTLDEDAFEYLFKCLFPWNRGYQWFLQENKLNVYNQNLFYFLMVCSFKQFKKIQYSVFDLYFDIAYKPVEPFYYKIQSFVLIDKAPILLKTLLQCFLINMEQGIDIEKKAIFLLEKQEKIPKFLQNSQELHEMRVILQHTDILEKMLQNAVKNFNKKECQSLLHYAFSNTSMPTLEKAIPLFLKNGFKLTQLNGIGSPLLKLFSNRHYQQDLEGSKKVLELLFESNVEWFQAYKVEELKSNYFCYFMKMFCLDLEMAQKMMSVIYQKEPVKTLNNIRGLLNNLKEPGEDNINTIQFKHCLTAFLEGEDLKNELSNKISKLPIAEKKQLL